MYEMKLLMEPTENSEKSEPQMGFEISSGARIFASSQWVPSSISFNT